MERIFVGVEPKICVYIELIIGVLQCCEDGTFCCIHWPVGNCVPNGGSCCYNPDGWCAAGVCCAGYCCDSGEICCGGSCVTRSSRTSMLCVITRAINLVTNLHYQLRSEMILSPYAKEKFTGFSSLLNIIRVLIT